MLQPIVDIATGEIYTARKCKDLGLVDELGDDGWVCFTFGDLHHLTDEELGRGILACPVVLDSLGVGGDRFLHRIGYRAGVGDLFQAFLLDDRVGITFARPHRFEDIFRDLAGNGVVRNALDQARKVFGRNRRVRQGK